MSLDLKTMLEMAKWDLPKEAKIEGDNQPIEMKLTDKFRATFPNYTRLISQALVNEFTAAGNRFRFYQWKDKDGNPIVWLADMELKPGKATEGEKPVNCDEIIAEHLLLIQNVGGILSTWTEIDDENLLTWSKNFTFGIHRSFKFTDPNSIYHENGRIFRPVDIDKRLPIKDLICFSEEANGNLTLYNKNDSNVYLLLGDHSFEYAERLDGHPTYSFYRVKGVNTFIEYTELLAKQLLSCIKVN